MVFHLNQNQQQMLSLHLHIHLHLLHPPFLTITNAQPNSQPYAPATATIQVHNSSPVPSTSISAASISVQAARNSAQSAAQGQPKGGKHIVGGDTLFAPRKIRTTGVNMKLDDMTKIGAQQSVSKV